MRIVSPARVHEQETGPVRGYTIRDLAWICQEQLSQGKPVLNHGIEINHVTIPWWDH